MLAPARGNDPFACHGGQKGKRVSRCRGCCSLQSYGNWSHHPKRKNYTPRRPVPSHSLLKRYCAWQRKGKVNVLDDGLRLYSTEES
eukprot:symbB.v1.2.007090.t1/scaffold431.1/size205911/3